jgi:hypothetical protein
MNPFITLTLAAIALNLSAQELEPPELLMSCERESAGQYVCQDVNGESWLLTRRSSATTSIDSLGWTTVTRTDLVENDSATNLRQHVEQNGGVWPQDINSEECRIIPGSGGHFFDCDYSDANREHRERMIDSAEFGTAIRGCEISKRMVIGHWDCDEATEILLCVKEPCIIEESWADWIRRWLLGERKQ